MRINRTIIGILFLAFVAFTSCKKEEGPVGPQGPAGPTGESANFTTGEYYVEAGDFQPTYAEIGVDIITEDIMESGVVLVYVLDSFGYWNNVPNEWTPIIGFSYTWLENFGGILGLDHDPNVEPNDYTIRVVTMYQRSHEELPSEEIIQDYDRMINYLSTK